MKYNNNGCETTIPFYLISFYFYLELIGINKLNTVIQCNNKENNRKIIK